MVEEKTGIASKKKNTAMKKDIVDAREKKDGKEEKKENDEMVSLYFSAYCSIEFARDL